MKKMLLLLGFVTLFNLVSTYEANAAQVTFGPHDKLVKICDLPDTDDYKSNDGKYFDFGYKYTCFEVVFLPIFQQGEGQIVGYIDEENFVVLSKADIADIAKTNNIKNLAGLVRIPFWDAWGGKLVGVLIILLLIGSLLRDRYTKKVEE
ncbi:hypothetical protein [Dysgonomonas alginatilytica]|nr:hypothetical protein [Dysgonomonas alginatilytica]